MKKIILASLLMVIGMNSTIANLDQTELLKIAKKAIYKKYRSIYAVRFRPYIIKEKSDTTYMVYGTLRAQRKGDYRVKGGTPFAIIKQDGTIIEVGHHK